MPNTEQIGYHVYFLKTSRESKWLKLQKRTWEPQYLFPSYHHSWATCNIYREKKQVKTQWVLRTFQTLLVLSYNVMNYLILTVEILTCKRKDCQLLFLLWNHNSWLKQGKLKKCWSNLKHTFHQMIRSGKLWLSLKVVKKSKNSTTVESTTNIIKAAIWMIFGDKFGKFSNCKRFFISSAQSNHSKIFW